jgi:Lipase (class 3)
MKLIFIHGRAQETFDEAALKQTWIDTWKIGLAKSGLEIPANVQIEFPYYGKLLIDLIQKTRSEKKQSEKNPTRSGIIIDPHQENEFLVAVLGDIAKNAALTRAEKQEIKNILDPNRGFFNWEIVQKILDWVDNKKGFTPKLMKRFVEDVFMYLTNRTIKNQINTHIENIFNDEPCVVVGHSLGSVVSYLVLKNNPQLKVKKFITIGSPLGLYSLRNYLEQPLEMPACVQNGWFNAYDDGDYIALKPLNKEHFNIQPPIENKKDVQNQTDNQHGIQGYLNDQVIALKIYEALLL